MPPNRKLNTRKYTYIAVHIDVFLSRGWVSPQGASSDLEVLGLIACLPRKRIYYQLGTFQCQRTGGLGLKLGCSRGVIGVDRCGRVRMIIGRMK
jgi:hypothetical protein